MAEISERLARIESDISHQKEMTTARLDRLEEKVDRNHADSAESLQMVHDSLEEVKADVKEFKELLLIGKAMKLILSTIATILAVLSAIGLKDVVMRWYVKT